MHADFPDASLAAALLVEETELFGGTPLGEGRTRLEGYASDEAVSQLEALGGSVKVVKSAAAVENGFETLLAMVDKPENPIA